MRNVVLLLILSSLLIPFSHGIPTGQGQQLFFDDFNTSQFSPYWNPITHVYLPKGNISQAGGWLTLSSLRTGLGPSPFATGSTIIASNNIQPLASNTTTHQFLYMVWRIVPFNLTQVGNNPGSTNAVRNAVTLFGLFSNINGKQSNGIGFELAESDAFNGIASTVNNREAVGIYVNDLAYPQTIPNCFGNGYFGMEELLAGCQNGFSSIMYSNPNNQIDLNAVHIFTIELSLDSVTNTSWAAFQVDQNGWYNVTQAACNCIDHPGFAYGSLYPYINSYYCIGVIPTNCSSPPPFPNQSMATSIDYILVDNYVPSSLPVGSPLLSLANNPANAPSTNNPVTNPFGGVSPSNMWQYFANLIGSGVPTNTGNFLMSPYYFGGTILFVITVILILMITLFTPVRRITSPFILSTILFFDTVANFVLGTLPVWEFAGILVFFMATMVGTIPSTIGKSSGGL